ncbi:oxidoreductase [Pseudodonghicola flavimaris]|uniref:Oxidoreductase n=1 Tax=Pseudodonghicola flavimaris TaxID=3050036 RepID=A0ABT7EV42_9RHOB|nr:oxidoreductase [Pseudodonghicola flavimaris]MDK3016212.1 oxidoreductase [Pseudodonghicola flavimaris]
MTLKAEADLLYRPLPLPCGVTLKNRIAKSAMSDALGDGCGAPTEAQMHLYRRWADGGLALSLVGEVQGNPHFAENPGNLVLNDASDPAGFAALARAGQQDGTQLWLQLGHAGALAYAATSSPRGPSALDLPGLHCAGLSPDDIRALPPQFARTARLAQELGFGGVQVHAAHGFLLSQFLSPLFNRRGDGYGGDITGRMRIVIEVVEAVRQAVGPSFPIAIKLNATDQLEGGLTGAEALRVVAALDKTGVDLIEISGGTYFPGASSASDNAATEGPYFLDFARAARRQTNKPLMLTGGFKTRAQALSALGEGAVDVIGLARAFVLDPQLPRSWRTPSGHDPGFPRFTTRPEGGVTAWYTMRLAALAQNRETGEDMDVDAALAASGRRDAMRAASWRQHFGL